MRISKHAYSDETWEKLELEVLVMPVISITVTCFFVFKFFDCWLLVCNHVDELNLILSQHCCRFVMYCLYFVNLQE